MNEGSDYFRLWRKLLYGSSTLHYTLALMMQTLEKQES